MVQLSQEIAYLEVGGCIDATLERLHPSWEVSEIHCHWFYIYPAAPSLEVVFQFKDYYDLVKDREILRKLPSFL